MPGHPERISLLGRADESAAAQLHDSMVQKDPRLRVSLPWFKDEQTLLNELSFVCYYHSTVANQVAMREREKEK